MPSAICMRFWSVSADILIECSWSIALLFAVTTGSSLLSEKTECTPCQLNTKAALIYSNKDHNKDLQIKPDFPEDCIFITVRLGAVIMIKLRNIPQYPPTPFRVILSHLLSVTL